MTTITAWRIPRYGAPDTLVPVTREIATPGPGQILVRIQASAVSRADGMMRAGTPKWARLFLGLRGPRKDLIGTCFSGEVIATGPETSRFAVGDQLFGEAGLNFGANASHICLNEDGVLMPKPADLPHDMAAVMCDGPLTSYNFLHSVAQLRNGERILILGASGSLGSAAIQLAAAIGANVTGTCSAGNVQSVKALGADQVIDYARHDVFAGDQRYDVVYDTLGISSFGEAKQILTENGRYVCPVLSVGLLGSMLMTALFGKRRAKFSATGMLPAPVLRPMLDDLIAMTDAGAFAPVMDRRYDLDQRVEAHRYVEGGHKRGNVVVTPAPV